MSSVLKRRADIRTLLFLGAALATFLGSLCLDFHRLSILHAVILFFPLSFIAFVVGVINHNHRHVNMFRSRKLNRLVDYVISFCLGAPSSRLHMVHVLNHHRYFRDSRDWTCYKSTAEGKGWRRITSYLLVGSKRIRQKRHELTGGRPALDRALSAERRFLYIVVTAATIVNPWIVLLIWIPAWINSLVFLFISNLLNHDECDLESDLDHSRDFLNRFENWLMFNNGYHTAHHLHPQLHWSDLPKMHAEVVEPQKDRRFVKGSMLRHLIAAMKMENRK